MEASGAAAPFFGGFVGESRVCERVVGRAGDAETFVSGGGAEVDLDGEVGGATACARVAGRLTVDAVDAGRDGCSAGYAASVPAVELVDAAVFGGAGGLILSSTGLPLCVEVCSQGSRGTRCTGPSGTRGEAVGVFGSPTARRRALAI